MPFADRYARNVELFGEKGQAILKKLRVAVAGVSGLGSPIAQHLALLGVGRVDPIDPQELDDSNRNRFIGARHDDEVPGSPKVQLSARLVDEIDPAVVANPIKATLVSEEAFAAVLDADVVFGCFDHDGPRAILNELTAAYEKPYIDLASDVPEGSGGYGGRVCVNWDGGGCLLCFAELDTKAAGRYLRDPEARAAEDRIYGVPQEALGHSGPAVSPLNAVVAGLAAAEFMVAATGMRDPVRLLNYYGHLGIVTKKERPEPRCYICESVRGRGRDADVERYLNIEHLRSEGTL